MNVSKLINLELTKLFKSNGIKVLFIILAATCFFTIYFSNKKENYTINSYNLVEDATEKSKIYNDKVNDYIKIYNYYKENNFDMNLKIKGIIDTGINVIIFLSIAVIIISSSSINEDINRENIKELLTKPHKRWKILLSKTISVFIIIFLLSMFTYASYTLFVSIITNTNIFYIKEIIIRNGNIKISYYYLTFLKEIFINSIPLYFISIMTIFLSLIINNSKVVNAIMISIVLMSTLIFQFLLSINLNLIEYTFLPYLDLTIYKDIYNLYLINIRYDINLSIKKGIIILCIYLIIFNLGSIFLFNKKDIM